MSTPFTGIYGTLSVAWGGNDSLVLAGQTMNATPRVDDQYKFVNGLVGTADAIDVHYEDVGRTLATGASHVYTLSHLIDTLPRDLLFIDIKALIIVVTARTAGDKLTAGPNSSNGWTRWIASGTIPIYRWAGFCIDKTDSLAVTAGSNDQFKITNAGSNDITYDFFCAGNTA